MNFHFHPESHRGLLSRAVTRVAALAFISLTAVPVSAETPPSLAVPAQYEYELAMPGSKDHFLRPARVLVDSRTDEVYVADPGHSRIVILDNHGLFKFEFSVSEYFGAPTDLAISSEGFIFVLGSTREGKRVKVFDFDGRYIRDFSADLEYPSVSITTIAIDADDRLYLLDESRLQVLCYSMNGIFEFSFPLVSELDEKLRHETVFGSLAIHQGTIYVPIATLGSTHLYDTKGNWIRAVGYKGSTIGELNFPISVAVSDDHIIHILDKHRHNVVCYSREGKFLGEFGGKGTHDGWFYHPEWIAVDNHHQVYIGQVFGSRVQVCSLPDFIVDRNNQLHIEQITQEDIQKSETISTTQADRRWSLANSQSTSETNHRSADAVEQNEASEGTIEKSQ